MTAVAGALFAYYRGFVSVEAFSLFLTIQYVAMIIIGGMGSLLGALLGAVFVTLFPYCIEAALQQLPDAQRYAGVLFAVNYAAFGAVMILFLVFEPLGLVGIWQRVQNYFLLWPFKHRPAAGAATMTRSCAAHASTSSRLSTSAPSPRCRASPVGRARGRSSPCSAPTAPARPRRCARFPAFSASTMRA